MNDMGPGKSETHTSDQTLQELKWMDETDAWGNELYEKYRDTSCLMVTVATLHPRLRVSVPSSDAYSTLDPRGRRNTLDNTLEPADKDPAQVDLPHLHLPPANLHDWALNNLKQLPS